MLWLSIDIVQRPVDVVAGILTTTSQRSAINGEEIMKSAVERLQANRLLVHPGR